MPALPTDLGKTLANAAESTAAPPRKDSPPGTKPPVVAQLEAVGEAFNMLADETSALVEETRADRAEREKEAQRLRRLSYAGIGMVVAFAAANLGIAIETRSGVQAKDVKKAVVDSHAEEQRDELTRPIVKIEADEEGDPVLVVETPPAPDVVERHVQAVKKAKTEGRPPPPKPKAKKALKAPLLGVEAVDLEDGQAPK